MAEFEFTWDESKNRSNQRKHGISFAVAARVFLDPLHVSVHDRIEAGEQRFQTIGQVDGLSVMLVAHTFTETSTTRNPTTIVRIISARRATRRERKQYEG